MLLFVRLSLRVLIDFPSTMNSDDKEGLSKLNSSLISDGFCGGNQSPPVNENVNALRIAASNEGIWSNMRHGKNRGCAIGGKPTRGRHFLVLRFPREVSFCLRS